MEDMKDLIIVPHRGEFRPPKRKTGWQNFLSHWKFWAVPPILFLAAYGAKHLFLALKG